MNLLITLGARVTVTIPANTALGALCIEQGLSRRRRATVLDPKVDGRMPLVSFASVIGDHEVPAEWVSR